MTTAEKTGTTQIHRVWIKATPEAIWTAITDPAWTDRYGYGGIGLGPQRPQVAAGDGRAARRLSAAPSTGSGKL